MPSAPVLATFTMAGLLAGWWGLGLYLGLPAWLVTIPAFLSGLALGSAVELDRSRAKARRGGVPCGRS